jgi:hypothetical protein
VNRTIRVGVEELYSSIEARYGRGELVMLLMDEHVERREKQSSKAGGGDFRVSGN